MARRPWVITIVATALSFTACQTPADPASSVATDAPAPAPTHEARVAALMPDLVGLPSAEAHRRLGELEGSTGLSLGFNWGPPVIVACDVRPGTVARQGPAPGTPLRRRTQIDIRPTALDLDSFRGPCEPADGDLGPVAGPDAVLAREFYRFAADPSLDAPITGDGVWTGIESGLAGITLNDDDLTDLDAWQLHTGYAERTGPFSALDIVAGSGGYYELHRGITPTCGFGSGDPPPELEGLRAISLTVPSDTISACMDWWGVTLFLEGDRVRGVALRLGSPVARRRR